MTLRTVAAIRFCLMAAAGLWIGIVTGCGPSRPPLETGESVPAATLQRLTPALRISEINRDGCRLTWDVDRQPGDLIRGYNVYVSTEAGLSKRASSDPHLKAARYGGASYPGDTDGDTRTESITIEGLETGVRYYVHVRTAFPNGQMSPPSAELTVVPRPRGEFVLHPRMSGGSEGFSFVQDTVVDWMSLRNDVYMFSVRDTLYLASPSRVNDRLRTTEFYDLGPSASIDDYPTFAANGLPQNRIAIRDGHTIAVTVDHGGVAKVRPRSVRNDGDSSMVTFDYMYQPLAGERQF